MCFHLELAYYFLTISRYLQALTIPKTYILVIALLTYGGFRLGRTYVELTP